MGPKRKTTETNTPSVKRQKKTLSLTQKVEILDRLAKGEGSSSVARAFNLNESTVRSMKKIEAKIRASVAGNISSNAKIFYTRDTTMQKMEKALNLWIEDQVQKGISLDGPTIRDKAKRLYDQIKQEVILTSGESNMVKVTPFLASKGWFEKFKKRYNLHNVKLTNESISENYEAEETFSPEITKLIKEKGYKPEQVFNASEINLFWKRMPMRTFLFKKEESYYIKEESLPGFKAAKDRLTLLLCGNASGDFIVKPMLLYRNSNPYSLKNKNKYQLPVFWRANGCTRVTADLFTDWFYNCFIHQVQLYLISKNIEFKILLILDNVLGHPESIQVAHTNVELVFLPSSIMPLVHPLDQNVIAVFKAYYTRRIFHHILDSMNTNPNLTIHQCWKNYTIADCIKNIKESLDELKPFPINPNWKNFWQEELNNCHGISTVHDEIEKIMELSHQIGGEGFSDLQEIEVEELLESHNTELSEDELEELILSNTSDDDSEVEKDAPKLELTIENLDKGFQLAKELGDLFFAEDPLMERSLKFRKELEGVLTPYREIYKDLKNKTKQQVYTNYFGSSEAILNNNCCSIIPFT